VTLKPAPADRFFEDEDPEIPESIPRHKGNGRPKIRHADDPTQMSYWARASSFAKGVESTFLLDRYNERLVARGMAVSPDLCDLAAVLAGIEEPADKEELTRIAGLAKTAAGGDRKANSGTALHKLRERRDRGEDLAFVPAKLWAALEAYCALMENLTIHASEQFVVCDRWRAAGSFDVLASPAPGHELIAPDGEIFTEQDRLIGDLKSGARVDELGRIERAVQQAVYAYGTPYEHVSDEVAAQGVSGRLPWPDWQAPGQERNYGVPSRTWALIPHVPLESPEDAALWWVDLTKAARIADEVAKLHELRKLDGLIVPAEAPQPAQGSMDAGRGQPRKSPGERAGLVGREFPTIPGAAPLVQEPAPLREVLPMVVRELGQLAHAAVLEAIELAADRAALDELWDKHEHEWRDEWTAAVRARLGQFSNGSTEVRTS
jgi:hypothetical protein